jgi:hypothetical protein
MHGGYPTKGYGARLPTVSAVNSRHGWKACWLFHSAAAPRNWTACERDP